MRKINNLSDKTIITCFLAACLEMYDFAIFGFLTGVLHKKYLSFMDETSGLIITYALFAVGFIFRPIGSIIFGYIGDIYGRKKALIVSVTLMGTASLGMFCLPTYATIGIASCYLIAVLRILQGISVGGEYSGALIYAVEQFNSKRIGIIGGVVICGCLTGVMVATIVSKIVQSPMMPEYSWRFAFLLGFGLSFVGYFIRKNLVETPEFQNLSIQKNKIPLVEGIKQYPMQCMGAVFIAAANGVNFYFILVFLPGYINKLTGVATSYFPILTTTILILLSPVFGWLSDKINRANLIFYGLVGLAFYSFIGLHIVAAYPTVMVATLFFCGQAILHSTQAATINIFLIEIFPAKYRFSCSSFCYSIGLGVVGGTSPLVATLIIERYGKDASFYISSYMFVVSALGFISVLLIKKAQALLTEINHS